LYHFGVSAAVIRNIRVTLHTLAVITQLHKQTVTIYHSSLTPLLPPVLTLQSLNAFDDCVVINMTVIFLDIVHRRKFFKPDFSEIVSVSIIR
jgi:hypothetical protein